MSLSSIAIAREKRLAELEQMIWCHTVDLACESYKIIQAPCRFGDGKRSICIIDHGKREIQIDPVAIELMTHIQAFAMGAKTADQAIYEIQDCSMEQRNRLDKQRRQSVRDKKGARR